MAQPLSITEHSNKVHSKLKIVPQCKSYTPKQRLQSLVYLIVGSHILFSNKDHVRASSYFIRGAMLGSIQSRACLGFLEEFYGTAGYAKLLIAMDNKIIKQKLDKNGKSLQYIEDSDAARNTAMEAIGSSCIRADVASLFASAPTTINVDLGILPEGMIDPDSIEYSSYNFETVDKIDELMDLQIESIKFKNDETQNYTQSSSTTNSMSLADRARTNVMSNSNQSQSGIINTFPNFTNAEYLYFQCALKGNGLSQARLTFLKMHGRPGIIVNHPVATYWKKECAKQGSNAISWIELAAKAGVPSAQFCLALSYYNGIAIEEDDNAAFHWCCAAAENNHSGAQNVMGNLFIEGSGCEPNAETGLSWYIRAAEKRESSAIYNIGTLFERGLGVDEDMPQAYQWYYRAATFGSINAKNVLGIFYEQGLGVEQRPDKAVLFYLSAAIEGHPHAQYNLGRCYHDGFGVVRDDNVAFKWFFSAAVQNHALAQLSLGVCFEYGIGVEIPDINEAIKCYSLSSKNGCNHATRQVMRLSALTLLPRSRILFKSQKQIIRKRSLDYINSKISLMTSQLTLDSPVFPTTSESRKEINLGDLPREIIERILTFTVPPNSLSKSQLDTIYKIADGTISESSPIVPIRIKTSSGTILEFNKSQKCYKIGKASGKNEISLITPEEINLPIWNTNMKGKKIALNDNKKLVNPNLDEDLKDLEKLKLSTIGFSTRKAFLRQLNILDLDMHICDCNKNIHKDVSKQEVDDTNTYKPIETEETEMDIRSCNSVVENTEDKENILGSPIETNESLIELADKRYIYKPNKTIIKKASTNEKKNTENIKWEHNNISGSSSLESLSKYAQDEINLNSEEDNEPVISNNLHLPNLTIKRKCKTIKHIVMAMDLQRETENRRKLRRQRKMKSLIKSNNKNSTENENNDDSENIPPKSIEQEEIESDCENISDGYNLNSIKLTSF